MNIDSVLKMKSVDCAFVGCCWVLLLPFGFWVQAHTRTHKCVVYTTPPPSLPPPTHTHTLTPTTQKKTQGHGDDAQQTCANQCGAPTQFTADDGSPAYKCEFDSNLALVMQVREKRAFLARAAGGGVLVLCMRHRWPPSQEKSEKEGRPTNKKYSLRTHRRCLSQPERACPFAPVFRDVSDH